MTTFNEAMTKAINGKCVYRSGWLNSNYLMIPYGMVNIYEVFPSNINNPTLLYHPTIADIQGSDWSNY